MAFIGPSYEWRMLNMNEFLGCFVEGVAQDMKKPPPVRGGLLSDQQSPHGIAIHRGLPGATQLAPAESYTNGGL
jgi:hypothetical protein